MLFKRGLNTFTFVQKWISTVKSDNYWRFRIFLKVFLCERQINKSLTTEILTDEFWSSRHQRLIWSSRTDKFHVKWWLYHVRRTMEKQLEKARLRLIMSSCQGQDDSLWQKFLLGIWKKHTEDEHQYCVEITKRDDQNSVSVSRYTTF